MHNFGVMAQVLLIGESGFLCLCDFKELGVAKQSRSTTSARSALRQPWSIIARTNFLKAATNLNVVQPKLFQASRQDDPHSDKPDPKSQRNFTDPESRIMK